MPHSKQKYQGEQIKSAIKAKVTNEGAGGRYSKYAAGHSALRARALILPKGSIYGDAEFMAVKSGDKGAMKP